MRIKPKDIAWIVAAVVVIAVLAVVVIRAVETKDSGSEKAHRSSEPQHTAELVQPDSPDNTPSSSDDSSTNDTDREAGLEAAGNFIAAFNTQKFSDKSASAWVRRTKPYVTDDFYSKLKNMTRGDSGGTYWTTFVKRRTIVSVSTTRKWVVKSVTHGSKKFTAGVQYTVSTSSSKEHSSEDGQKFVTMIRTTDGWKATGFNTSDKVFGDGESRTA